MKDTMELIKGLIRPIITLGTVGALTAMIFLSVTIPDWFQVMVAGIIAYWFASRTNGNG